jgi:hypothetical protein
MEKFLYLKYRYCMLQYKRSTNNVMKYSHPLFFILKQEILYLPLLVILIYQNIPVCLHLLVILTKKLTYQDIYLPVLFMVAP